MTRSSFTRCLAVWGLLAIATGCGESRAPTYPSAGVVRFEDGSPVRFGVVEFRAEDQGLVARGTLDAQGRFRLGTFEPNDGAVAGRQHVIVVQHVPPEMASRPKPNDEAHREHGAAPRVSPLFAEYATSPLQFDVSADGDNQFEIVVRPFSK